MRNAAPRPGGLGKISARHISRFCPGNPVAPPAPPCHLPALSVMSPTRAFLLASALTLFLSSPGRASIGIEPLPDQDIPSGKTLVVPIPAADPTGPARSYTVTVGTPTVSGSAGVS